jgi:hypothetical protein
MPSNIELLRAQIIGRPSQQRRPAVSTHEAPSGEQPRHRSGREVSVEHLVRLRVTREDRALWWTAGVVLALLAMGPRVLIAGPWMAWAQLVGNVIQR